jgi:hypothetical protein
MSNTLRLIKKGRPCPHQNHREAESEKNSPSPVYAKNDVMSVLRPTASVFPNGVSLQRDNADLFCFAIEDFTDCVSSIKPEGGEEADESND